MKLPALPSDKVAIVAMVLAYQRQGYSRRQAVGCASQLLGRGASQRAIWQWLREQGYTINAVEIRRSERRMNSRDGLR